MKPLDIFQDLVSDEHVDPPLETALRLMSDSFRGPAAWEAAAARLDELARAEESTDFASLVGKLFGPRGLAGDKETYDDPRNSFIDHCLLQGRGLPITLCIVGHLVGVRQGISSALVGLPGHVVVSDDAPGEDRRFFDPFNGGRELSREQCLSVAAMSGRPARAEDLAPMSSRAIVVRILNNLARSYQRLGDPTLLSLCVGHRWAMPEIRRLDRPHTLAMVRQLN